MTWDQSCRFAVALVIGIVFSSGAIGSAAQSVGFEDVLTRISSPEVKASVPRLVDGAWVLPGREAGGGRRAVEDYSGMIAEACAYYGCNPAYLESVMACESGGDPNAVAYNPSSGNYTRGLMQIDDMWGVSMAPADQIWWAAEHLTAGDVYWVCQ